MLYVYLSASRSLYVNLSACMSLAIMPAYIVREFNIFACMLGYVNLPARMTLYVRLFVFLHSIGRVSVCLHVIVREFAIVNVREFVHLHVLSVDLSVCMY